RKFRFRAPGGAWQSRNARAISLATTDTKVENHGIVTVSGLRPVSEFLIVGCQHGWLCGIRYDLREIGSSRDSHGVYCVRPFLVRNLLYLNPNNRIVQKSCDRARVRTADGEKNE